MGLLQPETESFPWQNGDPAIGVSTPLLRLIEKAEMLFERLFATYRKRPNPSVVTSRGCDPAANGEPGTGVRAPVSRFRRKHRDVVRAGVGHENEFPSWVHSHALRRRSSGGKWGARHRRQSTRLGVAAVHADAVAHAVGGKNKTAQWINNHPCRTAAGINAPGDGNQGSRRIPRMERSEIPVVETIACSDTVVARRYTDSR